MIQSVITYLCARATTTTGEYEVVAAFHPSCVVTFDVHIDVNEGLPCGKAASRYLSRGESKKRNVPSEE